MILDLLLLLLHDDDSDDAFDDEDVSVKDANEWRTKKSDDAADAGGENVM